MWRQLPFAISPYLVGRWKAAWSVSSASIVLFSPKLAIVGILGQLSIEFLDEEKKGQVYLMGCLSGYGQLMSAVTGSIGQN